MLKDNQTKKELLSQYRQREVIGGVYAIRNTLNDKILLKADTNLQGSKNRFDFSQKTGSCIDLKLQNDWNKQGGGQFVFEVLEELKKGETQTAVDFKADIGVLLELCLDKLSGKDLY